MRHGTRPSDGRVRRAALAAVLAGALLASGTATPASTDGGQLRIRVEWRQGRLSIDADDVPLRALLEAIASATSVEMRVLANVDESTSIHIANVTLLEGLETVLAATNYAIAETPAAGRSKKHIAVMIAGRKSDSDGAGFRSSTNVAQEEPNAAPDAYRTVEKLVEKGDTGALRDAATFADPAVRALALQRLSRDDPAEAQRVAITAVRSRDPAERAVAVHVLGALDSPESTATLGAALEDADSGVRHAAVVGLMGQTSPAATQLLQQALQDNDESIRELARDLLAQRERTQAPR